MRFAVWLIERFVTAAFLLLGAALVAIFLPIVLVVLGVSWVIDDLMGLIEGDET